MLGLMQSLTKSVFVKLIPAAAWKTLTSYNWNAQDNITWQDWVGVDGSWIWMADYNWSAVDDTNWSDWDLSSEN